MEISALQRGISAADLPVERLAGNANIPQTEKVNELSRQFEAVLLRQILSSAHKPVFASTMNPQSFSSGIYRDMVTNQLADSISRSGMFGVARSLEAQLQHQLKVPRADDTGDSTEL